LWLDKAVAVFQILSDLAVPPKKLTMNIFYLTRLNARVKQAPFELHIIHNMLEALTEPTLRYLIGDKLCLKGDT
jgi:hypothetical protein